MQRWVGLGVISDNLVNIGRLSEPELPGKSDSHYRPPPTPSGLALPHAVDQRPENINFAPGSRLVRRRGDGQLWSSPRG